MRDVTRDNFGLTIAYLLPGFVAMWGVAFHSVEVRAWLRAVPPDAPTVGGFLYSTLASIAAGLLISTVRWMTVDQLLKWVGLKAPPWDFTRFAERLAAFELLVAHQYRYYQFHANMFVAVAFTYTAFFTSSSSDLMPKGLSFICFAATESILIVGANDTLRKYYERTGALLQTPSSPKRLLRSYRP